MEANGNQRQITDTLMVLLRSELGVNSSASEPVTGLTPDALDAVYLLASRHRLEHLVADALWKQGERLSVPETREKVNRLYQDFLARYFRQTVCREYAFGQICRQFDTDGIDYLPLKGMELRHLWPEDWMRSCSDIDILIREEDLETARASAETLGYTYTGRTSHDISLLSGEPDRVHIELHYDTIEEESLPQAQAVLSDIWSYAEPTGQGTRFRLKPEMLYFYHVAHMAKHFQHGGCGIRFFLDLWLMERKLELDTEQKNGLLGKGGLRKFAEGCVRLSEVWMEDAPADELTEALETYIVDGGIYGNLQNRVAVGQRQKRSYVFSRLFIPMSTMRERYPVLKRCPFLLPAMYVHRFGKMVTDGRMKRTRRELALNRSLSKSEEQKAEYLIEHLGLRRE